MLKLWGSRQEDLETYRDITDDVEESDFVPYACLYNPHTILTKNGELLQTIKITGLTREQLGQNGKDLRNLLRDAIRNHITSDNYALWFHTIRRKRNLSARGNSESPFAQKLDEAWEARNHFSEQFANEVFLTIVREGQNAQLAKKENFLKAVLPARDLRWRNGYIDSIYEELEKVSLNITNTLSQYGAYRLGIYEKDGTFYSEMLEFLEKITNLVDRPMEVPEQDLSLFLTSGEITFGFNAMEVRVADKRRFASLMTLKEYKEVSLPAIDEFLQLPMEFIVTQCVDFINPEIALKQYLQQKVVTRFAANTNLSKLSELDAILESDRRNPIDFGQQQLSIFLIADSLKQIELQTQVTIDYFKKYGMVVIREDLHFEQCYWAQLPGNFEFIARLQPTYTSHTGGFSNLHNFPIGNVGGSKWGNAVTTFHTANGTPYFFNFHVGENGHTWVVGNEGSGKAVLSNFLITHATKFSPQIFYFDNTGRYESFAQALSARIHAFTGEGGLNPFSLANTPANRQFLARWLGVLLRIGGKNLDDATKSYIERALEHTISLPETDRHLESFFDSLGVLSPDAKALFFDWMPGNIHGNLFTGKGNTFGNTQSMQYFNLAPLMNAPAALITTMSLLVHMVEDSLNGKPSILYLGEALKMLRNTPASMNIPAWLASLSAKNAIAIFSTEPSQAESDDATLKTIASAFATRIFLPNEEPDHRYQSAYGLNEIETGYLSMMDKGKRHFLLRQRNDSLVAELNLNGMEEILDILSGRKAINELKEQGLPKSNEYAATA